MRLVQFQAQGARRKVGLVVGDVIQVLATVSTTYALFQYAQQNGLSLPETVSRLTSDEYIEYDVLLQENRILVPLDHPDTYHTWITGTGLTHLGSAASRNAMHQKITNAPAHELTDSMRLFQMGVNNGKMSGDVPAAQPEWFYKGNGLTTVHPGQPLSSPAFALDGGEEPEIVGLYINGADGHPHRIGFALGNEFSDHQLERTNYLYLAHSKLRPCSYGPELLVGELPNHIVGKSRIWRNNQILWEKEFLTGEANMSHNLANLEHHHFKYALFRQPGDVHVHFFGTSVLSFSDQITTQHGDVFDIEVEGFGRPLRNPLRIEGID